MEGIILPSLFYFALSVQSIAGQLWSTEGGASAVLALSSKVGVTVPAVSTLLNSTRKWCPCPLVWGLCPLTCRLVVHWKRYFPEQWTQKCWWSLLYAVGDHITLIISWQAVQNSWYSRPVSGVMHYQVINYCNGLLYWILCNLMTVTSDLINVILYIL